MTAGLHASIAGYAEEADRLTVQYESIAFEEVHALVLDLMPAAPADVLDIGAGTGRDAAVLAARGFAVTAVEPTAELRAHGERLHADVAIAWLDDSLPDLPVLAAAGERFDLVLLTAVLMHLDAGERTRAMARIAALLALCVAVLWQFPAFAATYELGAPPVARITLPDAWSPKVTGRGVEATTDDDEIYVAVRPAALASTEEAVKQALAYLLEQGVKIDVATQRERTGQINGMEALSLAYSGKDEDDEDVEISVSVVIASPSSVVVLTYWGSKEGERT
ncbi:MAG: methyltransferase domain-containing protein [Phreatobacter sp.]|nr:methyltransferase domain-containing protein [Phreatobacter sp.]